MALIVEDGTIVADANGYITRDELVAYWTDRGVSLAATGGTQKEEAIIIATEYVDNNNRFKGAIVSSAQELAWPRFGVVDDRDRSIASTVIPKALKSAVCEYAKRQIEAPLQPDVGVLGTIKKNVDKTGPIEDSVEYQDGTGGYFGVKAYPTADNYLTGLLDASGGMGSAGVC